MAEKRLKSVIKRDIEKSMATEGGAFSFDPPMLWLRGACRIDGDAILLDVDSCESYLPSSTNVLYALLCLDWPLTTKTIKKFVAEYGLLRNGIVERRLPQHPQIEWQKDLFVTPHQDDFSQENVDNRVLKESLGDWKAYVGQLLDTMEVFYYLRRAVSGDNNAIGHLRARLTSGNLLYLNGEGYVFGEKNDFELCQLFSRLVAGSVNFGLRSCSPRVIAAMDVSVFGQDGSYRAFADPMSVRTRGNQDIFKPRGSAGIFSMSYYSRALITSAWHNLACHIAINKEFHRCEKCNAFFCGERAGRKYCSDRCSSNARQIRKRQKDNTK